MTTMARQGIRFTQGKLTQGKLTQGKFTQGKTAIRRGFVTALALAMLAGGGAARAADTFEMLRKGGYTLFFRHTQADWGKAGALQVQGPAPAVAKADACPGERTLSDEGRADARALGIAVKSLKLTVTDVVAANLCRMKETASIAFGAPKTVADLAPRPGAALSLTAQAAAVERLAGAPLPANGLRVIIGDYEVAQALYGVTLAEGDAVVLKTGADGRQTPVAHLRLGDWRAVAPVASSAAVGPRKF